MPWAGERAPLHDRGTVLTHAMLVFAGSGEACSDIEFLASQQRLFGAVASDSTLYRTIRAITPAVLTDLTAQAAITRAQVWRRRSAFAWLLGIEARRRLCGVVSDGGSAEPKAPVQVSPLRRPLRLSV